MTHNIHREGKTITLSKEEVRDIIEAYNFGTNPRLILGPAISAIVELSEDVGSYFECAERHLTALPMYMEMRRKGEAYANDPVLYECILTEWVATRLFALRRTNLDKRNYYLGCIDTVIHDRIQQIESILKSECGIHDEMLRRNSKEYVNSAEYTAAKHNL